MVCTTGEERRVLARRGPDRTIDHRLASVSLYEAGLRAFGSLDRSTMLNGIASFNSLREDMRSFLLPFAQNQRVVTREVRRG